ncbi:MAG: GNAT family N-acetyltransferase, partial [Planctomycetota bacterium]
ASIAGSMCFGVYTADRQVGFARVITDGVTFGYLADVFILEPYRNQGLGKMLTQTIVDHPRLRDLRRFLLFTVDAHALYAEFDFQPVEGSRQAMQIYRGEGLKSVTPSADAEILPPSNETIPYKPRTTRMVQVQKLEGWNLKIYTIHAADEAIDPEVITAAIQFVQQETLWPQDQSTPYGFTTVHRGEQAIWLLVDLWIRDILHHFVYYASQANPTEFQIGPQDGTAACVWELEITKHERDAWVHHVLADPNHPRYDSYLEDSLEILP